MNPSKKCTLGHIVLGTLLVLGCAGTQHRRPVRIEGSTTSWLLLRDGDILHGSSSSFPYFRSDGQLLRVTDEGGSLRLSGRVVSLDLDSIGGCRWLAGASKRDLAQLRGITLNDSLDPACRMALGRLAATAPHVGLHSSGNGVTEVLPHFQPRMLWLSEVDSDLVVFLSQHIKNLNHVETMIVGSGDSLDLRFVSSLPRLRQLRLWDGASIGSPPGPPPRLKILSCVDDKAMQMPSQLEELVVCMDSLVDLRRIAPLRSLRFLSLSGSTVDGDLSSLAGLEHLEWMGLPENTTQEQFAAFVTAHPGLRTLELLDVEAVTDLTPLRRLKRLEGLYLVSKVKDLAVLKELPSLQFVVLAGDSTGRAALQKELPGVLIVGPEPVCLGSGWILLLLPIAGAAWTRARKMRRSAVVGERVA